MTDMRSDPIERLQANPAPTVHPGGGQGSNESLPICGPGRTPDTPVVHNTYLHLVLPNDTTRANGKLSLLF